MRKTNYICSLMMVILLPLFSFSQIKSLRVSLRIDSTSRIDEQSNINIEKLISQSEQIISAYNDKASFYDIDKGRVSSQSIGDFKSLFHGGAYVFNDLVLYGRRVPIDEYTSFVADNLRDEGVNFKISNLLLKSATKNPASDNQYEIVVKVIKLLTKIYDREKKKFIEIPQYKQMPLEFVITVQGEDLDKTQIYGIDGKIEDPPPPKTKEIHFFGAYSAGMPGYTIDEKYAGNSINLTSKSGFDIGIKYSLAFFSKKKSKLLLGISYGNFNYNINSESILVKNEGSLNNKDILVSTIREMEDVKLNNIKYSYIQARLGANVFLTKGFRQLEFGLGVEFLPTYIINGGQNLVGKAKDYTTYEYETNKLFCLNNSIDLNDKTTENGNMLFGAEIKAFGLYYLEGRRSAISLGLAYRRYLSNWVSESLIFKTFLPHNVAMDVSFIKKLN